MTLSLRSRKRTARLLVSSLLYSLGEASQPTKLGTPGQFELVGNSIVSAQQLFLGTNNKVYIIDKTENNPTQINGHPAWASEYDVNSNTARPMDVLSNTFCAGGSVLGNGTWLNVGGNQAVTYGGDTASSQTGGAPYDNFDGGKAIRFLDPCDDGNCNWVDDPALYMTTRRWYPTLETLEDGSIIIIGGNQWGGFVNDVGQNNPTYEFFPSRGPPVGLKILDTTLPANLFPLTWLLPSGNLFIQSNWGASIFDYKKNTEYPIGEIPHAVRTYPASGATIMLPLTPANQWQATILFCGGTDLQPDQWGVDWAIAAYPADASCVKITPDVSQDWIDEGENLPDGRSMGNFIHLPDGTIFLVNGANTGTAGYGNQTWAVGHSYADNPLYMPLIYDPEKPVGQRMSSTGFQPSKIPRMYHSSATILPDGSVFVSGSNPNPDYVDPSTGAKYPTDLTVERFYPPYYSKTRPDPQNLPTTISYGGPVWTVSLSATDLQNSLDNLKTAKVVVIRPGFSTHAMNMGQRYVQLDSTYTGNQDGSGTLNVAQLPPNPAVLPPGPALLFVVVNGVPSVGQHIMVGNGQIGKQPTQDAAQLPQSSMPSAHSTDSNTGNGSTGTGSTDNGNTPSAALSNFEWSGWVMALFGVMSILATL
ncbi:hypothetical protein FRC02_009973 [Tulasnella sp. 418]|nr:hypothetical protein FRC02_009973 [Tulasnella sp. 418]